MAIDLKKLDTAEGVRELARERGLIDANGLTRLNRKVLAGLKGGDAYEYGLCISMIYDEPIMVGSGSHAQRYRRASRYCSQHL